MLLRFYPRRWAKAAISRYQAGGGGLRYFGIACHFEPSCSQYTKLAIEDKGLWVGGKIGLARIRRCQHKGLTDKINDPYV